MASFFLVAKIKRDRHERSVAHLLRTTPIVALVGPRQSGKTTLALTIAAKRKRFTRFDLESPRDLERLRDPLVALESLRGLVVLDEIQRAPHLFPVLRVLADRPGNLARFLLLGSAAGDLARQGSESLAGRIAYHEIPPLALDEVGANKRATLWRRGGFPRSFLATREADSDRWRDDFVRTFLERDLAPLGLRIPTQTLFRFWSMLAHHHAQIWNGAELARAFAMSESSVRSYLDALTATFMVRQLQPWHENLKKRQVRSPKIFLGDSGVLHSLLGIAGQDALERHPKVGASWEGFAIDQVVARLGVRREKCFFWATHQGAELDLLVLHGTKRLGFEVKRTSAPRVTPSMRIALSDLDLDRLDVIYEGARGSPAETYALGERIRAVPLSRIFEDIA